MKRWMIAVLLLIILIILSLIVFEDKIKSIVYVHRMESDERVKRLNIEKIISSLGIKQGDSIADIGAGSGLFSRKFAPLVTPSGKVYAVDINKDLLKHIDDENTQLGIINVKTILASESDPKLPERVNLIFICDTLHNIDNQEKYVKTMAGYLNSKGRLAVISFKNWPEYLSMSNKFSENDLTNWTKKAGLELINSYDFLVNQYLKIYKMK